MKFCLALILSLITTPAFAQTEHTLVRRLTVFPIKVADPELEAVADAAWWEVRETLAKDKRFLIASRNFLQQKDVYQERAELSPADAIILGKLLDSNALVTTYVDDRVLHMNVYEGEYGRPLWMHKMTLQPSLPVAEQLQPAVMRLAQDFVAAIPYHGFVKLDPLKGGVVYRENKRTFVKAEIGTQAEVDVGDSAQLVRITSDSIKPLFTSDARQGGVRRGPRGGARRDRGDDRARPHQPRQRDQRGDARASAARTQASAAALRHS